MPKWSLHRRGRFYYAQLFNQISGKWMTAKSTGCTEEHDAILVVADWLNNGVPQARFNHRRPMDEYESVQAILDKLRHATINTEDAKRILDVLQEKGLVENAKIIGDGPSEESLAGYLERFWDYEQSEYVREKLSHGQTISRRYCSDMQKWCQRYWIPHFSDTTLSSVTRQQIKKFSMLLAGKGLAPATVQKIMVAGSTPLQQAYLNEVIPRNPAQGLKRFAGKSRKRGILDPFEVRQLFSMSWRDERSRVGNLVAMTTGARSGEVLAIRSEDIGQDKLFIRHSWSDKEGLKSPKNGESRIVPLLPSVREALLGLVQQNPHDDAGFVFFHYEPDRPCGADVLRDGLRRAYIDMKLEQNTRDDSGKRADVQQEMTDRGVCFHSWRHFYASHISDKVDLRSVQLATGHKTQAMAEHYANHANSKHLQEVAQAATEAFGGLFGVEDSA